MGLFDIDIDVAFDPKKAGMKKSKEWGNPRSWDLESTFYEMWTRHKFKGDLYPTPIFINYFPPSFKRYAHIPDENNDCSPVAGRMYFYCETYSYGICYKEPIKTQLDFDILLQNFIHRIQKKYG